MEKEHHDYSIFLAIIAIWMMLGAFAQCQSASHLDDIRQELRGIKQELYPIRYR